jgi:hypothetical protein
LDLTPSSLGRVKIDDDIADACKHRHVTLFISLIFGLIVQAVILYFAARAAVLRALQDFLALMAAQSSDKHATKAVQDDFRAVVRWVKTIEVGKR